MSIEVEIKVKIQNRKQIMDSLKKIGFLENRCSRRDGYILYLHTS